VSLGRPSYEQLAALVVKQAGVIEGLRAEVAELKAEVADLKRRLAQNSRNSSRPPSSDGLSKPAPKSLRRPSGRKPGGQQGHQGGHLAKVAVPDEVVDHVPSVCAGCQGDLDDGHDVGHLARQVFDLPEIGLRVCEHRAQRRRCACGHETTAAFPAAVTAPVQYGPRVLALGLYLVSFQHLPYARAAQLLSDWIGAPVSTGTLAAFMAQGAEDLQPFLDEVHAQIRAAPVAHFDETGARAQGRLRWLFCASTDTATFYGDHDRRRGAVQQALPALGAMAGQPLARGALADPGRLGGRAQRPPRHLNPLDQQLAALQAEPRVSVQLHPVSSLGLVASTPTSLQGGPDEQRPQELQLASAPLWMDDDR
jgi:transposase